MLVKILGTEQIVPDDMDVSKYPWVEKVQEVQDNPGKGWYSYFPEFNFDNELKPILAFKNDGTMSTVLLRTKEDSPFWVSEPKEEKIFQDKIYYKY